VQVKDLDIGLLDFPCAVEDEIVLLCWKYGEAKIEFWHGTEEGFAAASQSMNASCAARKKKSRTEPGKS